ncbi:MAG: hypothetical protein ACE5IC_09645 [Candidatus Brocadiales bacterium]
MAQMGVFDWKRCPAAERFLMERVGAFLEVNQWAANFTKTLEGKTSTLFFDWIDHIIIPDTGGIRAELEEIGFSRNLLAETPSDTSAFSHTGAIFPAILVKEGAGRPVLEVALKPESVADFAAVHGLAHAVEGAPLSRYRRLLVSEDNGTKLLAVERRAYQGYLIGVSSSEYYTEYATAEELWRARNRWYDSEEDGFRETGKIVDDMISRVGRDLAGHIVFRVEREYWLGRNRAARVQKGRQDTLGLGWGNHDHHTFRCSRTHMPDLIKILEKLGFECRERFYAGEEAGWGAQVLEHPVLQIAIFADLDLAPEETEVDFAHQPLPMKKKLGTVGLWVGLHGESFFQAGLHHVAGRFDFERLREDLVKEGVSIMEPFSYFDFLKQAFAEGEVWRVIPERAKRLLEDGSITEKQYKRFIKKGARGSHLENLQRREGFKGFNQKSVSAIIQATDPRW